MTKQPHILLIYTGGTIGMIKNADTGALKAFDFSSLLDRIPELRLLDCTIDTVSFKDPIDSSNMNPKYWGDIATIIGDNYSKFDGFVVLHGSDTMSYTASALSFMLENLAKPVILTGSQLPIGDLRTDAKENLITSIQMASLQINGWPVIREVGLYFEYKLYRGNRTTKLNAEHFEAFESYNYPHLAESGVHLNVNSEHLWKPKPNSELIIRTAMDSDIGVLKLFPGISRPICEAILTSKLIKGLIIETYGSGNATTETWFLDLLKNAIKKGLHIVNVTQCVGGSVNMGQYETSSQLKSIGIISGRDITTEAAIAKMMYLLGEKVAHNDFKFYFETSLRGEMS
ncbi:asparaginase [Winogradskyella bathintestinalis]|uniref:Type I asparaginase n=1 Tax=Winogradskyella bathintestinalis TaxID=3035208 RepID=A0ABT7ZSG9_9FLAO|nr:type I asparaginase [Winogradskyella bathintestinalis]MDN3491955.1 type I asparaginase [Winogradskyella bathintestinalis]